MVIWLSLLIPSAIIGCIFGLCVRGRWGSVLAGAVPWFGLLAFLLYHEYVILPVQDSSGGASMWPIAQLFAGTIAAVTGVSACYVCRAFLNKNKNRT